jgi:Fur family transcriptional regulator, ferric uptake regulator
MTDIESGVRGFAEFLSRAGLKSTRQRDRIVRAFFAAGRHISAEELYHQIRAEDPTVGLVTVYRTLKLLRQAGLATERQFGDSYARFDPTPADHTHHHLICTRCGSIREFENPTLRALGTKAAHSQGFTVTEQRVEIYGICQNCAAAERRRPARRGRPAAIATRGATLP